ncbi:MAG: hypothetical protein KDC75_06850 [Phaeodactylibacter sp.]|nr:hypothetical protein [Phaeodactylibacter sp.]
MNSDNFTQYLEDPSRLYQASYQELKTLALQYPYCQNLHLLLFQKSYMDGSGDWENNLEKAAIYSIDRKHLYHQARKLDKKAAETDNFLLSEEFLELKSLESLHLEEGLLSQAGQTGREEATLQLEFGPMPQEPSAEKKPHPVALSGEMEEEEEDADELFDISAGMAPQEENGIYREEPHGEEPGAGQVEPEPASDEQPSLHDEAPEPGPLTFEVEEELIRACSGILFILENKEAELHQPPNSSAQHKTKEATAGATIKKSRRPLPSPELAALKEKTQSRPPLPASPHPEGLGDTPKPQPKKSFTSWIEKFQSPNVQVRLSELMESKKREESKRKRKKNKKAKAIQPNTPGVGRLAIRSITENKEILSETLAELLVSQGEYHRATEMYQALMLVFPQKSDFFAEKIENLKRK